MPEQGPRTESARVLSPEVLERAYAYNREGMKDMSMARFPEAIEKFGQAAGLAGDYEIRRRPLVYTPVFMTAWAYEKMDDRGRACRYYGEFLKVSPPEWIEASKRDHARNYLSRHCGREAG